MATNTHDDLNSEPVHKVWKLYHPVSGDEKEVVNNGTLTALMAYLSFRNQGYETDTDILVELWEDNDD